MKKNAKARMKKRRDRFIVGYIGAKNVLFGKNKQIGSREEVATPMTRIRARKALLDMPCADCAIFELVPVEVNR